LIIRKIFVYVQHKVSRNMLNINKYLTDYQKSKIQTFFKRAERL